MTKKFPYGEEPPKWKLFEQLVNIYQNTTKDLPPRRAKILDSPSLSTSNH